MFSERPHRVWHLLIVIIVLATVDLLFTLWALCYTPFEEQNPVAASMMHSKLFHLCIFKMCGVLIGVVAFWLARRRVKTEVVLWVLLCIYAALMTRWDIYTRIETHQNVQIVNQNQ